MSDSENTYESKSGCSRDSGNSVSDSDNIMRLLIKFRHRNLSGSDKFTSESIGFDYSWSDSDNIVVNLLLFDFMFINV